MKFLILTPSLNQLPYLKRCVASVRDQAAPGLEVRHVVIDGASTDGTMDWLRAEGIEHISEPDQGMYDALNKGLDRFFTEHRTLNTEHYLAWLNADEQYLPGTLMRVAKAFARRPDADVLCGGTVIVDAEGRLRTFWKSLPLRRLYLSDGTLYNLTCAMFFRAHLFAGGRRLDSTRRAAADWVLVDDLLSEGNKTGLIDDYLAAYTFLPENMSNQSSAEEERAALAQGIPVWKQWVGRVLRAAERVLRGTRRERFPLAYALYMDPDRPRREFSSPPVAARWPNSG